MINDALEPNFDGINKTAYKALNYMRKAFAKYYAVLKVRKKNKIKQKKKHAIPQSVQVFWLPPLLLLFVVAAVVVVILFSLYLYYICSDFLVSLGILTMSCYSMSYSIHERKSYMNLTLILIGLVSDSHARHTFTGKHTIFL